jgi:hypothetical protein
MGLFDRKPAPAPIVNVNGPKPLDTFWCEGEPYTIATVKDNEIAAVTYIQIGEARKRKVVHANVADLVKRQGHWTLPGREGAMNPVASVGMVL